MKKNTVKQFKQVKVRPNDVDSRQPLGRFLISLFNLFEDEVIRALSSTTYSDITRTDLNTLRYIDESGISVGELAVLSGVTKQAVSKQIENLRKRGYVQKKSDPTDARVIRIKFTQKGIELLGLLFEIIKQIEDRYEQTLGKTKYSNLKTELSVLIRLYR